MAKRKKKVAAPTPTGIRYGQLKGMSYSPSTRDKNRKDRQETKRNLKHGE